MTPEQIGWAPSTVLASVDKAFITTWVNTAKQKLGATIQNYVPIKTRQHFHFLARFGSIFPISEIQDNQYTVLVPVKTANNRTQLARAKLTKEQIHPMPWAYTPNHIHQIINTLIGRSYDWGGQYGFNDCSRELKNFFIPFGLYLPRHSSHQISIGNQHNLSKQSVSERLSSLTKLVTPWLTLIYVDGHIMLYIGQAPDPDDPKQQVPYIYQNAWSLKTSNKKTRLLIGNAMIIPFKAHDNTYPQALSRANERRFIISDLSGKPRPMQFHARLFKEITGEKLFK